ncbi:hypothetical protein ADUPG1_014155 [Aduncisulcus paluster]|uniref:Uncharacterized protein n=1 Tax=Aduncisulcus paluster TaxID=2918883 RepID=A0ABQ5KFQ9_9EUKA|nr:hypothetical protein ADUPG1_014155 [Aduncisulcus paluster]
MVLDFILFLTYIQKQSLESISPTSMDDATITINFKYSGSFSFSRDGVIFGLKIFPKSAQIDTVCDWITYLKLVQSALVVSKISWDARMAVSTDIVPALPFQGHSKKSKPFYQPSLKAMGCDIAFPNEHRMFPLHYAVFIAGFVSGMRKVQLSSNSMYISHSTFPTNGGFSPKHPFKKIGAVIIPNSLPSMLFELVYSSLSAYRPKTLNILEYSKIENDRRKYIHREIILSSSPSNDRSDLQLSSNSMYISHSTFPTNGGFSPKHPFKKIGAVIIPNSLPSMLFELVYSSLSAYRPKTLNILEYSKIENDRRKYIHREIILSSSPSNDRSDCICTHPNVYSLSPFMFTKFKSISKNIFNFELTNLHTLSPCDLIEINLYHALRRKGVSARDCISSQIAKKFPSDKEKELEILKKQEEFKSRFLHTISPKTLKVLIFLKQWYFVETQRVLDLEKEIDFAQQMKLIELEKEKKEALKDEEKMTVCDSVALEMYHQYAPFNHVDEDVLIAFLLNPEVTSILEDWYFVETQRVLDLEKEIDFAQQMKLIELEKEKKEALKDEEKMTVCDSVALEMYHQYAPFNHVDEDVLIAFLLNPEVTSILEDVSTLDINSMHSFPLLPEERSCLYNLLVDSDTYCIKSEIFMLLFPILYSKIINFPISNLEMCEGISVWGSNTLPFLLRSLLCNYHCLSQLEIDYSIDSKSLWFLKQIVTSSTSPVKTCDSLVTPANKASLTHYLIEEPFFPFLETIKLGFTPSEFAYVFSGVDQPDGADLGSTVLRLNDVELYIGNLHQKSTSASAFSSFQMISSISKLKYLNTMEFEDCSFDFISSVEPSFIHEECWENHSVDIRGKLSTSEEYLTNLRNLSDFIDHTFALSQTTEASSMCCCESTCSPPVCFDSTQIISAFSSLSHMQYLRLNNIDLSSPSKVAGICHFFNNLDKLFPNLLHLTVRGLKGSPECAVLTRHVLGHIPATLRILNLINCPLQQGTLLPLIDQIRTKNIHLSTLRINYCRCLADNINTILESDEKIRSCLGLAKEVLSLVKLNATTLKVLDLQYLWELGIVFVHDDVCELFEETFRSLDSLEDINMQFVISSVKLANIMERCLLKLVNLHSVSIGTHYGNFKDGDKFLDIVVPLCRGLAPISSQLAGNGNYVGELFCSDEEKEYLSSLFDFI